MLELRTPKDLRKLGGKIDDYIKEIIELDYGFYTITNEQREILTILENLVFVQEHFNKGIRLRGFNATEKTVEIYDIHKKQAEMDKAMDDFEL